MIKIQNIKRKINIRKTCFLKNKNLQFCSVKFTSYFYVKTLFSFSIYIISTEKNINLIKLIDYVNRNWIDYLNRKGQDDSPSYSKYYCM
jgi:hypothetical protein